VQARGAPKRRPAPLSLTVRQKWAAHKTGPGSSALFNGQAPRKTYPSQGSVRYAAHMHHKYRSCPQIVKEWPPCPDAYTAKGV